MQNTINRVDEYVAYLKKENLVLPSTVKGGNVHLPNFTKAWERMKNHLGKGLEKEGFENYYFPMFIPIESFKKQEAHFKGFFDELIIAKNVGDKALETEIAIRPTSEVIMYESLKEFVGSAKLPVKINQFCSVVRWEFKRPNVPLLRDNEFLWQESHSMHKTEKEAIEMTEKMLAHYKKITENVLCLPCVVGEKPNRRKFAGAVKTFAMEALMPDGKSIQLATSHYLGTNFSEPFELKNNKKLVYQSCHGITTRALGATIFYYFDKELPPAIFSDKKNKNKQKKITKAAKKYLSEHFFKTEKKEELEELLRKRSGFVESNWCNDDNCARNVKELTGASLRVTRTAFGKKKCIICGKHTDISAVFAPSY